MRFISKTADFSADNIGNANRAEAFIQVANITSIVQKAAIRNIENALREADLWNDFDVIRIMGFQQSLADSLNLKNPLNLDSANRATIKNDNSGAHVIGGFTGGINHVPPGVNERFLISNYILPEDLTNFHVHAYNNTPEGLTGESRGFFGNKGENALGIGNYDLILGRNFNGQTVFGLGTADNASPIYQNGYDRTKTGLLSGAKFSGGLHLYDGGVQIATGDAPAGVTGAGSKSLTEACYGNYYSSECTFQCFMYGKTAWNNEKEIQLLSIIEKFKTDLNS
ncbi:hypothetical protein ACTJKN_05205 [Pedobacter sp. 22163]|uniref:hypothetical protein n=1 Tax=Pedobacter sp. 22163 TaxID=3453883 RepID=UPI003F85CBC4